VGGAKSRFQNRYGGNKSGDSTPVGFCRAGVCGRAYPLSGAG